MIKLLRTKIVKVFLATIIISSIGISVPFHSIASTYINENTLMRDIKSNPSIAEENIYLYDPASESTNGSLTLTQFLAKTTPNGSYLAKECAEGLNSIISNHDKGITVNLKIYNDMEILLDATKQNVGLYYFPAPNPGAKFVVICPGGAYADVAVTQEGMSMAAAFNRLGYSAFVLRYRVGLFDAVPKNYPQDDLARAIFYIRSNADALKVNPNNYAVAGCSAGGHLAATWGLEYDKYFLPKPATLMLHYAWCSFMFVPSKVTTSYPSTFMDIGKNDGLSIDLDYTAMKNALIAKEIPNQCTLYENAPHSNCTGTGTDAEGWITRACQFWEQQ